MPFNEQSFRKAAKEAGYLDADIDAEVAAQKNANPPVNTATGKPFGEWSDIEAKKAKEAFEKAGAVVAVPSEKSKEQSFGDKFLNFIDPTKNPLAGPTEAILGYKAAEMALNKAKDIYQGLKDRSINQTPMSKGGDVVDVQAKEVAPIPKDWQDIVARSERNAAAKAADAAAKAAAQANPVPQNYSPSVPTVQPNAPVNTIGAFTQPSGYGQTTSNIPGQFGQPTVGGSPIVPTAEVGPVVTTPANVVSTGSTPEGAAAPIEKAEEIKAVTTPKKVKTPISPEDANLTKQELGMKKHLLEMYGAKDYPTSAAQAYEKVKDILGYTPAYPVGKGGSLNPEEKGKVLGYRKENIAGPKVNLTKDMKTILRKGGPAVAALVATTEFANAKTAEQKANAGANLIGAILPPGADIFEAGAPTVGQQAISNAYLLGSPYAQTEEAKLARLREKAGAGRGIAPPSAYMR